MQAGQLSLITPSTARQYVQQAGTATTSLFAQAPKPDAANDASDQQLPRLAPLLLSYCMSDLDLDRGAAEAAMKLKDLLLLPLASGSLGVLQPARASAGTRSFYVSSEDELKLLGRFCGDVLLDMREVGLLGSLHLQHMLHSGARGLQRLLGHMVRCLLYTFS
jgi:hypothetical protein